MLTILIAGHYVSLQHFCTWANGLIGDELVDWEGYTVSRIEHFQIIPEASGLNAVTLLALESNEKETEK